MSKGLQDFDYDAVAEMLNNISSIAEHASQQSIRLIAVLRVLVALFLLNILLMAAVLFFISRSGV